MIHSPRSAKSRTVGYESIPAVPIEPVSRGKSTKKRTSPKRNGGTKSRPPNEKRDWSSSLARLRNQLQDKSDSSAPWGRESHAPTKSRLLFLISQEDAAANSSLLVHTYLSTRRRDGEWGVPQKRPYGRFEAAREIDVETGALLHRLKSNVADSTPWQQARSSTSEYRFPDRASALALLPEMAAAGSLVWSTDSEPQLHAPVYLKWDGRECLFHLTLRLVKNGRKKEVHVTPAPSFEDGEPIEWASVTAAFAEGILLCGDQLFQVSPEDAEWVRAWQRSGEIVVPMAELDDFLAQFTSLPLPDRVELDPDIGVAIEDPSPQPRAIIKAEVRRDQFGIVPEFLYGSGERQFRSGTSLLWDPEPRALVRRNVVAEQLHLRSLKQHCSNANQNGSMSPGLLVTVKDLPKMTYDLVREGWQVVAEGKLVRSPGAIDIQVESGQDWFDLEAEVDYEGVSASLPAMLRALKTRQPFVQLDDGTQGILPEEWLKKYAPLADIGEVEDDAVRFARPQALLLDAMLADEENVQTDREFTRLCKKMQNFDGIKPGNEPRGFTGELREYQRDGVGWFGFLRDFQFGGCLADDMGLGKTVQVLALLQSRKNRRMPKGQSRKPSLVVVPKSLVFNWIEEAQRFASKLRVLNYTGIHRHENLEAIEKVDLIVTTYGTVRNDVELLRETPFDYVILDEAQAVKNARSLAAKAVRLLPADHRLAMTGTPVENHLGELWSLFDFLNPGMLGTAANFRGISGPNANNDAQLEWLANAIRPFILRRTKEQVLKELPPKTEQTLHVDMTKKQAKKYDELRDYYRINLSKKVEELGIKRSKIHVLEALLRLRQVACDPRLLDADGPSGAKLEVLLDQLESLLTKGHKALVFSQFTSLLALVRTELDEREWTYEYLDGRTRKREDRVKRFQEDDDCRLFLISLKAGGSGLNLTAADYVFILDPWWNPAAEAQAVDRAHRIGQTKSVMAYRVICKDTVEDKIVKLQESKRDLADAIITADKSLISSLSVDDLQMLLG